MQTAEILQTLIQNLNQKKKNLFFLALDIQELICSSVLTQFATFVCVCVSQERIAKTHGSQCGFCTPGIVMSMYALLRNKPTPRMSDVEEAFHGSDSHVSSSVKLRSH